MRTPLNLYSLRSAFSIAPSKSKDFQRTPKGRSSLKFRTLLAQQLARETSVKIGTQKNLRNIINGAGWRLALAGLVSGLCLMGSAARAAEPPADDTCKVGTICPDLWPWTN
jgi:hypothetical protein